MGFESGTAESKLESRDSSRRKPYSEDSESSCLNECYGFRASGNQLNSGDGGRRTAWLTVQVNKARSRRVASLRSLRIQ